MDDLKLQDSIEVALFCNNEQIGGDEQKRREVDSATLAKFLKDENISPDMIISKQAENKGQLLVEVDGGKHKWALVTVVHLKLNRFPNVDNVDKRPIVGWYKKAI